MLPQLSNVPSAMLNRAIIGVVFGLVWQTNLKLTVCAFAASAIASPLLFAIANPLFGRDLSVRSLKVAAVTDTAETILTILAFRRLQLIATTGTAVYAGLLILSLVYRISLIRQLENPEGNAV